MIRLLLRLFPARFRAVYGEEIEACLRTRLDAARGESRRAVLALWLRTAADLLWTALREHLWSSFDRPSSPRSTARTPRDRRGDTLLRTVLYDLRVAARTLMARPGISALVVITLAIGIGANTAIFSVVRGVLLRPLPFADPEQLVNVWGRFDPESGFDLERFPLSLPEIVDYRRQTRALESVAAYTTSSGTLTGGDGEPERVPLASVTPGLLETLGVEPYLGRGFLPEEGAPGGPDVAILSWGLWQERYGGRRQVLGRDIEIDGIPARVVGVMGPQFAYPGPGQRLWRPLQIDPASPGNRSSHFAWAVGRLAEGADLDRATAEMRRLMAGWASEYPEIHTGHYLYLSPAHEDLVAGVRPALLTLLVASSLVLLLACANVAMVLLARGEERVHELAVRTALGAGRGRLMRSLLSEGTLLALAGGIGGLLLTRIGQAALVRLQDAGIPRGDEVRVDGAVLLFAGVVSLATVLLSGLAPALRASRVDPAESLRETGRGVSGRLGGRSLLVAGEIALCFVLLLGAGLTIRSLDSLLAVDPGFRTEGRLVARIALPAATYDPGAVTPFYEELLRDVRALPGVAGASLSGGLPMVGGYGSWDFSIEGLPEPGPGEPAWNAAIDAVYPGYFETLGIPVLAGRPIEEADRSDAEPVVVVNRRLARLFLGDDPLGRRLRISADQGLAWMRVVGVVDDARDSLEEEPPARYYIAAHQARRSAGQEFRSQYLTVRSDGDPIALVPSVRNALGELDPRLPLSDVRTLRDVVESSTARRRYARSLMSVFALVAVVLGASGIYGVMAHAVASRSREMGIRKALGAAPRRVVAMVVRQGLTPVFGGILAGAVLALWTARLIGAQLYGVTGTDPATWAGVLAAIVAIAAVACLVPTARALRVDPASSLRAD